MPQAQRSPVIRTPHGAAASMIVLAVGLALPICAATSRTQCWRLETDQGLRWVTCAAPVAGPDRDPYYSPVTALAVGEDGSAAVAVRWYSHDVEAGTGIFSLRENAWEWDYGFLGPSAPTFSVLSFGTHGQLWAGHSRGLVVRDGKSWVSIAGYYREYYGTLGGGSLSADYDAQGAVATRSLAVAADGRVWVVRAPGGPALLQWDWIATREPRACKSGSSPAFPNWRDTGLPEVVLFSRSEDKSLWALRKDWACLRCSDSGKWQVSVPPPPSPPTGIPTAFHVDRQGTLWAATVDSETSEIVQSAGEAWSRRPELTALCANRYVGSIAEDASGTLYFAADGVGVIALEGGHASVHPATKLLPTIKGSPRAHTLLRFGWAAMPPDKRRLFRAALDPTGANVPVGAVAVAPDDSLWIGGNRMVVRWGNTTTGEPTR